MPPTSGLCSSDSDVCGSPDPAKNWWATRMFLPAGSTPDSLITRSMAPPYPWTSASISVRTSETLK